MDVTVAEDWKGRRGVSSCVMCCAWKEEDGLEIDSGDGCIRMGMHLMPLKSTLNINFKVVDSQAYFMYIYHNKNRF